MFVLGKIQILYFRRKLFYCFSKYLPLKLIHCSEYTNHRNSGAMFLWIPQKPAVHNRIWTLSLLLKRIFDLIVRNKKKTQGERSGLYGGWVISFTLEAAKKSVVRNAVWGGGPEHCYGGEWSSLENSDPQFEDVISHGIQNDNENIQSTGYRIFLYINYRQLA